MKTLLSGCSFSAQCGWQSTTPYSNPRCWYNIVAEKYNLDLTNISKGGSSNREIIHRAKQEILLDSYDLVIVALTSTNRVWYWRENEPLENAGVNGANIWGDRTEAERDALTLASLAFHNKTNEVERDLVDLLMLQKVLPKTQLLLVNFSNFGLVVMEMLRRGTSKNTVLTPIELYNNKLARLSSQLDLDHSIGFDIPLITYKTDLADDQRHPGVQSNIAFSNKIGQALDQILGS